MDNDNKTSKQQDKMAAYPYNLYRERIAYMPDCWPDTVKLSIALMEERGEQAQASRYIPKKWSHGL